MGEPLYRGKGKCSGLTNNRCNIVPTVHGHAEGHPRQWKMNDTPLTDTPETGLYAGLNQLHLLTSNSVVLGEDKHRCATKQAMPASSMGRATTCLPMDTVSGNDGTLKPNPKLHVPDRACTSTPRCRLVARMGHVWVPHENWQAMVEDKKLGGSCPGTTLIGALARGDRAFCCQSCGECTDKPGILGAVGLH